MSAAEERQGRKRRGGLSWDAKMTLIVVGTLGITSMIFVRTHLTMVSTSLFVSVCNHPGCYAAVAPEPVPEEQQDADLALSTSLRAEEQSGSGQDLDIAKPAEPGARKGNPAALPAFIDSSDSQDMGDPLHYVLDAELARLATLPNVTERAIREFELDLADDWLTFEQLKAHRGHYCQPLRHCSVKARSMFFLRGGEWHPGRKQGIPNLHPFDCWTYNFAGDEPWIDPAVNKVERMAIFVDGAGEDGESAFERAAAISDVLYYLRARRPESLAEERDVVQQLTEIVQANRAKDNVALTLVINWAPEVPGAENDLVKLLIRTGAQLPAGAVRVTWASTPFRGKESTGAAILVNERMRRAIVHTVDSGATSVVVNDDLDEEDLPPNFMRKGGPKGKGRPGQGPAGNAFKVMRAQGQRGAPRPGPAASESSSWGSRESESVPLTVSAKALLANDALAEYYIIDVREEDPNTEPSRVSSSPAATFVDEYRAAKTTLQDLRHGWTLALHPTAKLLLVCGDGHQARRAAEVLREQGFAHAVALLGGINGLVAPVDEEALRLGSEEAADPDTDPDAELDADPDADTDADTDAEPDAEEEEQGRADGKDADTAQEALVDQVFEASQLGAEQHEIQEAGADPKTSLKASESEPNSASFDLFDPKGTLRPLPLVTSVVLAGLDLFVPTLTAPGEGESTLGDPAVANFVANYVLNLMFAPELTRGAALAREQHVCTDKLSCTSCFLTSSRIPSSRVSAELLENFMSVWRVPTVITLRDDQKVWRGTWLSFLEKNKDKALTVRRDYESVASRKFMQQSLEKYLVQTGIVRQEQDGSFAVVEGDSRRDRNPDNLPKYAGNNKLSKQMMSSFDFNYPEWYHPGALQRPSMWLGPRGSFSAMHQDHHNDGNLAYQVLGAKRWHLFPPRVTPWTYSKMFGIVLWAGVTNPEAFTEKLNKEFPRFRIALAHTILIDVEEGELLYNPDGVFHAVYNVKSSLMLNFWVKTVQRRKDPNPIKTVFTGGRIVERAPVSGGGGGGGGGGQNRPLLQQQQKTLNVQRQGAGGKLNGGGGAAKPNARSNGAVGVKGGGNLNRNNVNQARNNRPAGAKPSI